MLLDILIYIIKYKVYMISLTPLCKNISSFVASARLHLVDYKSTIEKDNKINKLCCFIQKRKLYNLQVNQ